MLLLLLEVLADVLEVNAVDILRLLDEPLLVCGALLDLRPQQLEIADLRFLLVLTFHKLLLQVLELMPQLALLVLKILQLRRQGLIFLFILSKSLRRLFRLSFFDMSELILPLLCRKLSVLFLEFCDRCLVLLTLVE